MDEGNEDMGSLPNISRRTVPRGTARSGDCTREQLGHGGSQRRRRIAREWLRVRGARVGLHPDRFRALGEGSDKPVVLSMEGYNRWYFSGPAESTPPTHYFRMRDGLYIALQMDGHGLVREDDLVVRLPDRLREHPRGQKLRRQVRPLRPDARSRRPRDHRVARRRFRPVGIRDHRHAGTDTNGASRFTKRRRYPDDWKHLGIPTIGISQVLVSYCARTANCVCLADARRTHECLPHDVALVYLPTADQEASIMVFNNCKRISKQAYQLE